MQQCRTFDLRTLSKYTCDYCIYEAKGINCPYNTALPLHLIFPLRKMSTRKDLRASQSSLWDLTYLSNCPRVIFVGAWSTNRLCAKERHSIPRFRKPFIPLRHFYVHFWVLRIEYMSTDLVEFPNSVKNNSLYNTMQCKSRTAFLI